MKRIFTIISQLPKWIGTIKEEPQFRYDFLHHQALLIFTEGFRTTDMHECFDPNYLQETMLATQEIVARLDMSTKRPMVASECNVIEMKTNKR